MNRQQDVAANQENLLVDHALIGRQVYASLELILCNTQRAPPGLGAEAQWRFVEDCTGRFDTSVRIQRSLPWEENRTLHGPWASFEVIPALVSSTARARQ